MPRKQSDFVLDSKLKTQFLSRAVRHTRYIQGHTSRERQIQVKEVWDRESDLGRGSFGVVRLERRRSISTPNLEFPCRLRAVKEIQKRAMGGNSWDYMKELEIIAKFSHPRYAPYFVRTYGWFENADAVFITMEYFPLGDLQKFMRTSPPFSEEATRQIVRQLLEGMEFMHESDFAHRDIKPGNILVESNTPEWLVKIADFGISKQAREGETSLRTQVGTLSYMAPEVMGFLSGNDPAVAYSVAIDIWAIGVIAFELLFKRLPFRDVFDLTSYVLGNKPLDLEGASLPESCRDFLGGLIMPNPVDRPTAVSARNHPWMVEGVPPVDREDSLFVTDSPMGLYVSPPHLAATPASLAWSDLPAAEVTDTPLTTYHGPQFDSSVLIRNFQDLSLETTTYFVMRSDNEFDIESSVAHGVWTSSQRVNKILDKGFSRANGRVILVFSVIKRQVLPFNFCGVAQMTSPLDWENTDDHWMEDTWRGRFTVDWLCLTEVSFDKTKTIPVSQKSPGFRAIACYDGTEVSALSGYELLKAFSSEESDVLARRANQSDAMSLDDFAGSL
ncbi:calcium/calmodulin-dependent protein kinase [Amylocarpus encephaloides]|uniref:non-specific serine/threonine protein kinase n=1 Tax=Amylocarpus encephaloides TaxID=45428 RepID=A0A9P7YT85_9HELO|nr:calcium/calmodulin-dependent protein kinase [Amylocarpus encephaloides]